MKNNALLLLLLTCFCISGTFAQNLDDYWIYENFSSFNIEPDYIIQQTSYNTSPNNIQLKAEYANIESTEGNCNNPESGKNLRIRGTMDNGWTEFTVENAKMVILKVKGKSDGGDRIVNIYRNGTLIETIEGLDRNNCATFRDDVNTSNTVTYKITGGDIESTKPVVLSSIYVVKYGASLSTYEVVTPSNPTGTGAITGGGTYLPGDRVELTAYPYLGYIFENWTINGNVISSDNPYSFDVIQNESIVANFKQEDGLIDEYWIYDDFARLEEGADYFTEEKIYTTSPNNISLKTVYANFEKTEGDCQNESSLHLRIRGASDDGYTEFTVPNAASVTIKVKGKSSSADRIVNIYRDGTLVRSIMSLDKNNCEVFSESINSSNAVTYKITGGDLSSTKPVVVTSIIVSKYIDETEAYTASVSAQPENAGIVQGGGKYFQNSSVQLKAIPNLGYKFNYWESNGQIIASTNPMTFNIICDTSIIANFSQVDLSEYWIYDDFSLFEEAVDYVVEKQQYATHPNQINIETEYANFEKTEGECNNESSLQLRIRGAMDNGWAEFTVPNASNVTINVKGKSVDSDRIIKIFRDGELVKTYQNLDRDNCASFKEKVNSELPVTYKIMGGDAESSKPVIVTSIYVQKYEMSNIDNTENETIRIYPNPVESVVYVNYPTGMENAVLNIYNVAGICLITKELNQDASYIDLSELADGVYMMSVTGNNNRFTQRLVKQ